MEYFKQIGSLEKVETESQEEEAIEEELDVKGKRSFLCMVCSKHWCKILSVLIISLTYLFIELFKELLKEKDSFVKIMCGMHIFNITSIDAGYEDVCKRFV